MCYHCNSPTQADDVLVISCDLVTSVQLHLLTDHHSTHGSTLTTLLVRPPDQTEETRKKGAIVSERDIIGLADESRLVYFSAEADLDEHLEVSRSMLRRLGDDVMGNDVMMTSLH